jgi:DMSO/TMAO reductase YedYZ molybdopterin-dependent catalytic subunit
MADHGLTRRGFIRTAGVVTALAATGKFPIDLFAAEKPRLIRYPEKTDLILLTSRPPQLETPQRFFKELLTPNDALFVRWHLGNIPTKVDLATWRLAVGGNTGRKLELSMDDLRTRFEKVEYTAVIQCSGNGRSFFDPGVPGGQWGNGAMGNTTWSGPRLKDILEMAGVKPDSHEVAFNGLDAPPMPKVPDFVKTLPMDLALDEDTIVAYEMNGKPLLMLNGFPARLIVPGWFATYWVKALSEITVLSTESGGFWMKPAYRIPDNPCACVAPGGKPAKTVPINRMNTRSLIISPEAGVAIRRNQPVEIMGIAFAGGYGIKEVVVSTDDGKTWGEAMLGKDLGKYSWIQWRYPWKPGKTGTYRLMAKATNSIGESQPSGRLWNPSGYMWNTIEKTEVVVR